MYIGDCYAREVGTIEGGSLLSYRSRQCVAQPRVSRFLLLVSIEETCDSEIRWCSETSGMSVPCSRCRECRTRATSTCRENGNSEKEAKLGRRSVLTLKLVLDKGHWVIVFAGAHGLDARAEAGNR